MVLDIYFSDTGKVRNIRIVYSSGNKEFDEHSKYWVRKLWSLPPGNEGWYRAPIVYLMRG